MTPQRQHRSHGQGPTLTISIINHRSRDELEECLESIERHPYTLGSTHIVVVDNDSGDGSVEMVRERFPNVDLVERTSRAGFGANQNLGIARSTSDLVFLLNPDALVEQGVIDALVDALDEQRGVVAAGCLVRNADGSARQTDLMAFMTPRLSVTQILGMDRRQNTTSGARGRSGRGWVSGGSLIMLRSAFLEVGGFDETFFMYAEDMDLCKRLVDRRYQIAFVPDVAVIHPISGGSSVSAPRQVEHARGDLAYMRKHHGSTGAWVYRISSALRSIVRAVSLSLPMISQRVSLHGQDKAVVRRRHLTRARSLLLPLRGPGLREASEVWNAREIESH